MEQVLITASTVVGAALALLALLAIAIFIDAWSQARADILIYNAVADYELRRALDKSLDNFCRKCIYLMVQEHEEERSRGLR